MGLVNFDTNVTKNVAITKSVNLTVDKVVTSAVDIQGCLATAEASADSTGGGGGGGGGTVFQDRFFLIDGFDDLQQVDVNTIAGETSASGFAPNILGGTTPNPNGATFNATDIPGGIRLIEVVQTQGDGIFEVVANPPVDMGQINISTPQDGLSNNFLQYTSNEPAPDGDPFSVLVDCPIEGFPPEDCTIDLGDSANNYLIFDDVELGAENGTLRFEAEIEDADGTVSTIAAYAVSQTEGIATGRDFFTNGQDIIVPLGLFTGDIAAIPDDVELDPAGQGASAGFNNGFYSAGVNISGGDGDLDLTQVVRFELRILGELITVALPQTAEENPTTDAYDVSFDLVGINSRCVCEDGDGAGNLAEVDTFAQCDEFGAYAFAESLAASSGASADMLLG
jgi:hypothetical protein